MKVTVHGTVPVSVSITIEVDDIEDAPDVAAEEFGGITGYCGNGGNDKLIGVRGTNESISCMGPIEWDEDVEVLQ